MSGARRARVRALAKINLSLKVLGKRPDGFHELRTVFQTISLADSLGIEFEPAPETRIELRGNADIPDNLVVRAARAVLDAARTTGRVAFHLTKRIPMGAGLGGGSSDAAAVLLALPALAGANLGLAALAELGGGLGSDVPFFLYGGTALGLGRGTELYPLPDARGAHALVVAPDIHVSTPEAYRDLGRELTTEPSQSIISTFQSFVWQQTGTPSQAPVQVSENDFEAVVFRRHPRLGLIGQQLEALGAGAALLSGSGSALFGIFGARPDLRRARQCFPEERVYPVTLVNRRRYRAMWWRQLEGHITKNTWPPLSRYA